MDRHVAVDEHQLPIDIHYNKLLDWLIDRRHCDAKWLVQLRPIREKVVACASHLPLDEQPLTRFKKQQHLNYFHCRHILQSLKSLDGDAKTLFGKFTSARVQEWAEIVHAYEKRSVYLPECAQLLVRNVNYEIPALKQAMGRCQQIQRDCIKREQEAHTNAAALTAKFVSSCKEMGIKGERVREELCQLLSELSDVFQQTVSLLPTLVPALDYYQSFIKYTTERPVQQSQFLPMLNYIMKNGNVTVYQWEHGTEPEPPSSAGGDSEPRSPSEELGEEEIDWGDVEAVTGEGSSGGGVVEWQDVDLTSIEIVEDSERETGDGGDVKDSQSGRETGVDVSDLLESLLAASTTRSLFLDDVMEVKEFLWWRVKEMSRDDVAHFSVESEAVTLHGLDSVEAMLGSVKAVLEILTNPRTQHLLLMKSSPHYLDRLAGSILSPQLLSNKATAQAEAMAARREEAVNKALDLQPQLTALVSDTKELQKQVEQQISQLYKNREVNVIGEINVI